MQKISTLLGLQEVMMIVLFALVSSGAFSNLCDKEQFYEAFQAFKRKKSLQIYRFTDAFSHLIQRCMTEDDQIEGREIYWLIVRWGLDRDTFLGAHLIRMFTAFGSLSEASQVFESISEPSVFAWNAIITAHLTYGRPATVVKLYNQMHTSGAEINGFVLVNALRACGIATDLERCRLVHSHTIYYGFLGDVYVGSTLIDSYAKCCSLEDAKVVFHSLPMQNIVTWSALIAGHAFQGSSKEALEFFVAMMDDGLQPNQGTFVGVLKACLSLSTIEAGNYIHSLVIESGLEVDKLVGSAVVDMYAKHGRLKDAQATFDRISEHDVVAWSALILGYALHGQGDEALRHFHEMLHKGLVPDTVCMSGILQLCPKIAAFEQGKCAHQVAVEFGLESDLQVGSALITFYSKGLSLADACMVFERLHVRSVLTWSAIISGCAEHSEFSLAFKYFESMRHLDVKPNASIFSCLLSACNTTGLVVEGSRIFKSVIGDCCLTHTAIHYSIMSDLLSRRGSLEETEDMLESAPFPLDETGWISLLLSCCNQGGNVDLGRRCFDYILTLGGCDSAYVLMSSIYAQARMQEELVQIEGLRYWQREQSKSYIEIDKRVHILTAGDMSHIRADMNSKLSCFDKFLQSNVEERSVSSLLNVHSVGRKEDSLCGHTEKLATAFGLLNTSDQTTIRVVKNVRMCRHCHDAIKIVSRVSIREVVVSDVCQVHHFKEGVCTCKDESLLL